MQEIKQYEVCEGKFYFYKSNGIIKNLSGGGFVSAIKCGKNICCIVAVPGYPPYVDASYNERFKNYWELLRFRACPGNVLDELKQLVEEIQPDPESQGPELI